MILNFFSSNKDYAARCSKFTPENMLQCYLNIQSPFTLVDPKCKDIFIREYVQGGYAQGINPLAPMSQIKKQIESGIDWVEADNLLAFLEESKYIDIYDGLILDEGGDPTADGPVKRGNSFVAFHSNQIKLITNKVPTNSQNINE